MTSSEDKSSPLISVIVAAHNVADVIGYTIESVQAQTYPHWEMVVTDDGSTDNTVEVIEKHIQGDSRIRLLKFNQNTGLAAKARNHSMKAARGEFFALLDSDDTWRPEKLEKQLAYLQNHSDADAVCTWYYVFGDPERVRLYDSMMWRFSGAIVTPKEILQQSLNTSTVFMRARCFHEMGGMDESPSLRSGQDYEFFIRLVMNFRVHRLREELAGYRLAPFGDSLSSARHDAEARRQRELNILQALRDKKALPPGLLRRREAIMYYNLARDYLFMLHLPFRRDLWRSVRTMKAPLKANVMFALSFLPAPLLRRLLVKLLDWRNRTNSSRKGK